MPLFAFVAGYVYAQRLPTNSIEFLTKKARRLLLPVLTVGTSAAIIQALMPGTNSTVHDWSTLHVVPLMQYWFLEALFLLFCLSAVLELLGAYATRTRMIITLAVACVVQLLFAYRINYFAIGGATYLLPYFIAGIAVTRYDLLNPTGASEFFWKVILLLGGSYALVSGMGGMPDIPRVSVLALMLGMAACATAIKIDWSNKPLAYIGRHSYAIFLFHVFFTAGVRIGAHQFGLYDVNLLVAAHCRDRCAWPNRRRALHSALACR